MRWRRVWKRSAFSRGRSFLDWQTTRFAASSTDNERQRIRRTGRRHGSLLARIATSSAPFRAWRSWRQALFADSRIARRRRRLSRCGASPSLHQVALRCAFGSGRPGGDQRGAAPLDRFPSCKRASPAMPTLPSPAKPWRRRSLLKRRAARHLPRSVARRRHPKRRAERASPGSRLPPRVGQCLAALHRETPRAPSR